MSDSHGAPGLPPSLAARFALERELGRGGFGRVLLVRDRDLDRPVALKLLALDLGDPELVARFEREARVTAGLRHPGLVEVYDHGVSPEGQPFIAYAFVEGRSLADLGASALAPSELRAWAAATADALGAIHRAALVHRDIKPENVLVTRDRRPVICDLGIVRTLSKERRTVVTAEGMILGTPAYLAPELWTGAPASPASDQWAWAAMWARVWAGHGVYRGRGPGEIAREVATWRPHLSDVAGADPDLAAVLLRALDPAPAARFPDMPAIAAALRGAASHPPAAAPRGRTTRVPGGPGPAERTTRKIPLASGRAAGRAAVAIAIAAGLGIGLTTRREDPAPALPPDEGGTARVVPLEERPGVVAWRRAMEELREVVGANPDHPGEWFVFDTSRDMEAVWRLLLEPRTVPRMARVLDTLDVALGEVGARREDGAWVVGRLAGLRSLLGDFDRATDLVRGGTKVGEFLLMKPHLAEVRDRAVERWEHLRARLGEFLDHQDHLEEGREVGAWLSPRLEAAVRLAQSCGIEDTEAWVGRAIRAGRQGAAPLGGGIEVLDVVARFLRGEDVRGEMRCGPRARQVQAYQEWLRTARDQVAPEWRVGLWARGLQVEVLLDSLCAQGAGDAERGRRLEALADWGDHEFSPPGDGPRASVVERLEDLRGRMATWVPAGVTDPQAVRERLARVLDRLLKRAGAEGPGPEATRASVLVQREATGALADLVAPQGRGGPWERLMAIRKTSDAWHLMDLPGAAAQVRLLVEASDARVEAMARKGPPYYDRAVRRVGQVGTFLDRLRAAVAHVGPSMSLITQAAEAHWKPEDMVRSRRWWAALREDLLPGMAERLRAYRQFPSPIRRWQALSMANGLASPDLPEWLAATLEAGRESPQQLVHEAQELVLTMVVLRREHSLPVLPCDVREQQMPALLDWYRAARTRLDPSEHAHWAMALVRTEHEVSDLCQEEGLGPTRLARMRALGDYLAHDIEEAAITQVPEAAARARELVGSLRGWTEMEEASPELFRAILDHARHLAGSRGS